MIPGDFGRIAPPTRSVIFTPWRGDPLMAIAILGWPVNVPCREVWLREVGIRGGRAVCDAGVGILVGGHSIDAPRADFWPWSPG
jgi:selenophosphate synthase